MTERTRRRRRRAVDTRALCTRELARPAIGGKQRRCAWLFVGAPHEGRTEQDGPQPHNQGRREAILGEGGIVRWPGQTGAVL